MLKLKLFDGFRFTTKFKIFIWFTIKCISEFIEYISFLCIVFYCYVKMSMWNIFIGTNHPIGATHPRKSTCRKELYVIFYHLFFAFKTTKCLLTLPGLSTLRWKETGPLGENPCMTFGKALTDSFSRKYVARVEPMTTEMKGACRDYYATEAFETNTVGEF